MGKKAENFESCLDIDSFLLEEQYSEHSSNYSYWNDVYVDAYRTWRMSKDKIKEVYAERYEIVRNKLEKTKKGKVTVKEVEIDIERDPIYLKAKANEIEADAEKERWKGRLEALRSRKDMLISLGAHVREEIKSLSRE